jgi:hypothetical protein
MNSRTIGLTILGVLTLVFLGCHRVHDARDFEVKPGIMQVYEVPASSSEQQLEVQVTADNPVNVYIVQIQEAKDAETKAEFDRSKAVESKKKVTSDTIKAKAPANAKYSVVIESAGKTAKGKLVIDGR